MIKVFLCAHKPFDNKIPEGYIVLDVSGTVKSDSYQVIDISQDEFTKDHNVCYGEGCAMRYLYNHPDLIPEYICFGHYRRVFNEFIGKENRMEYLLKKGYGAILKRPANHAKKPIEKNNQGAMCNNHAEDDAKAFIESVKEVAPEYWNSFQKLLKDKYQYNCNLFAMKKEHFLEMCEMCFRVLDHYDKKQGYKNNEDVYKKALTIDYTKERYHDVGWQARLQGFWLEWLTELYSRHKFGISKCYISRVKTL